MQILPGALPNFESQMEFYILNKLWHVHETGHKQTQINSHTEDRRQHKKNETGNTFLKEKSHVNAICTFQKM